MTDAHGGGEEMPKGTMKRIAAICSAIWWAASAVVPSQPTSSAADGEQPPFEQQRAGNRHADHDQLAHQPQSGRQKRPSTRYFLNGRQA